MVIDNLDTCHVSFGPYEADAELIVDPDRVLASTVRLQRFERHSSAGKVGQTAGCIERIQSPHSDPLDVPKFAASLSPEDLFGFRATERNNHKVLCERIALYVKRNSKGMR